ncbi:MAG: UDP-2,3-diacylglucosamine diphosphatase LpxI [Pseudomonadota bacterium]
MSGRLALIAGAGTLPGVIAARAGDRPFIAAMAGHVPDGLAPDLTFRLEHLGSTLERLRDAGVSRLCLVGKVTRPSIDPAEIDPATRPLVPRLMDALARGDDGALRALLSILEEAGFEVVGAHDIAPDLLPEPGVITGEVTARDEADAARGAEIVAALGAADVGQACVVAAGQALAVEALPGTDWMLRSLLSPAALPTVLDPLGMAADWLSGPAAPRVGRDPGLPPGGLLYKAPKPGQELRVDMPTIGPATARHAAEAGLAGIVIAAGGVLLLEREATIAEAEAAGLFLWVRP